MPKVCECAYLCACACVKLFSGEFPFMTAIGGRTLLTYLFCSVMLVPVLLGTISDPFGITAFGVRFMFLLLHENID